MIEKKDISVIVQGPIDDRTYETIDCYKDFGEVIISTWVGEDLSLLEKAKSNKYTVCQTEYVQNFENFINDGSCYFIAQTLNSGSAIAKKDYIIKTRSDELYPDLRSFISNINLYPDRLHTTDNGFWRELPFCLSNHLFYESKSNIINATDQIIEYCKQPLGRRLYVGVCEQVFGYFFMLSRGIQINTNTWKDAFRNNIFITKCAELKGHLHSGQTSHDRGFKRSSDPYPKGRMEREDETHDFRKLYQHIDQIT